MLYELIKPYSSVATIGMCKNAGKTTVLNHLIEACAKSGEVIGLTSIGRDGERSDVVTSTKKPEIFVYSGTVIATAEALLALGDISIEIIETTGMPTPMGEVVVIRSHSDGLVQIAGPSMTAQLIRLKKTLFGFGAERVFIDGALSRKSLAMPAVSDATILSTGASYSRDIKKTVADTAYAAALLRLPETKLGATRGLASERKNTPEKNEKFTVLTAEGRFDFNSAADAADGVRKEKAEALFVRGGITDLALEALFSAGRALDGLELIIEDGSRMLAGAKNYEKLLRVGARVSVLEQTRLAAVTVNPFSAYGEHYDKNEFLDAVRSALADTPVIDIKTER